jgi:hypothetical protein
MIARNDMMAVLIEACPSFMPQWKAFQEEWRQEAELPEYVALADLARHLIGLLERADTSAFPALFAAVEQLQVEGDHYVQEATTIGLLKSLQNLHLHRKGTEPENFRPYLGPVSVKWWDKVYRFWREGELLTDD